MLVLTPDQYTQTGYADHLRKTHQDRGMCKLVLGDNKSVQMPTRMAILNILYWEPLMSFGLLPTIKETFNIKSISSDSSSKIYSIIYDRFLDDLPNVDHMIMVHRIFQNVSRIYNFITTELGEYMPSIDGLSLTQLLQHPPIKELADKVYDSKWGTQVAEAQLRQDGKELLKILKDPKTPNNVLYHYIQAGVLKTNQIPQMLLAYGPRSDIDDTMRKFVISSSSFSGLKSPVEFATESLSAKKSIFFSRDVIKKSQYFGRKMRLGCSTVQTVHPGSCGSDHNVIPMTIKPEYAKNFLHKIIIDDGRRVQLTNMNIIDRYVGQTVNMVSQFGCNHLDGMCEHCAGYGKDRLIKYLPHGIHIGLLCSTKVSSTVSQKVLSAKHLINTNSLIYNLTESAAKYFVKNNNSILFDPKWGKHIHKYQIRIPSDALGPIVDLNLDTLPIAESFSKVSYLELLKDGDLVETIQMEYDAFVPYLSEAFLDHMRTNYNKLEIDEDGVVVPMAGFDAKQDVFKFIIMNDDMITYTKSVATFLTATIGNYNSVPHALNDFCEIVWRKSSIPIFHLETVLHNLVIDNHQNNQLCTVTDPYHVTFGKLEDVISNRTVSMELAFERLKDYFNDPQTSNIARPIGLFGPFFGILG